jgi:glycerol-3-phosphate dehydrogenase
MKTCARSRKFRYLVSSPGAANRAIVQSALYLYWLLGAFQRTRPRMLSDFGELPLLKSLKRNCFEYEEAHLPDSDARFVLQWILRARDTGNPALNYCSLRGGHFEPLNRQWTLDLEDRILQRQFSARARLVVNAAGVWTDSLNEAFHIETPYKHLLSKGVFLGLRRDTVHDTTLIVEKQNKDCYAFIPWGPISLWGPTETLTTNPKDGFSVSHDDVLSLIQEYDRHFAKPLRTEDIVSLRVGVRGLAVPTSLKEQPQNSQALSRKYVVHHDDERPWVSIHGGKLTSCVSTAETAIKTIRHSVQPSLVPRPLPDSLPTELESFPGLADRVPSARSCAEESCWSLEDYLRRRTNISQWVPRGGLGRSNQNVPYLEHIATAFATSTSFSARTAVAAYRDETEERFDQVLSDCSLAVPVEVI